MTTAARPLDTQARAFAGSAWVVIQSLRPESSRQRPGRRESDQKKVERLVGLFALDKCRPSQELKRYLYLNAAIWHSIFRELAQHLDARTVELLQGLSPFYSTRGRQFILDSFESGELFPSILESRVRLQLQERVCRVKCLIPSLYCFLEDTKLLESCTKILRRRLPAKFRGTIRKGFWQCYFHPKGDQIWGQRDEDPVL